MDLQTAALEVQRMRKFFLALAKLDEVISAAHAAEATVKNLEAIQKKIEEESNELNKVRETVKEAKKRADGAIRGHKEREDAARRLTDAVIEEMHKKATQAKQEYEDRASSLLTLHDKQKAHLAAEIETAQGQVDNIKQQRDDLEAALAALRARASAL